VWKSVNTIRFSQLFYLGLGLLPLGLVIPARSENSVPAAPTAEPADQLPASAKTVVEWQAQIAQAQVKVTQVTITPTADGLEIRLETADNKPLQVDASKFRQDGNAFVAEIPNTSLALSDGQPFSAINPTADVASVQVSETVPGTIQVRVTGNNAPPKTDITLKTGALIYGLNPTIGDDEEEELIVTGATTGYAVPNASVGTRTNTPIKDIPQSIVVIPRQVIEDQGSTTVGDALRNSSSDSGLGRDVFENGLTGLRGVFGSRGDSNDIDLTNIEQIEVLRGPASVLYGVGQAGGLVNLTTKQPLDKPFYRLEGSIGSLNFYRASIDFSGPLNADRTVLYRLNAAYRSAGSPTDFVSRQEFSVYPTLSVQFSKDTKLTLEAGYTEFTRTPGERLPALGTLLRNPLGQIDPSLFLGEPDFNREKFWAGSFGYRFEHQINSNWQLKNRFQYAFSNYDLFNVSPVSLAEDNRTVLREAFVNKGRDEDFTLQTEITGKIQTGIVKQDLLFGVDLRRFIQRGGPVIAEESAAPIDIFNPIYGQPIPAIPEVSFDNEFTEDTLGIFAQNLISIGKQFKILLGGRFDWIRGSFEGETELLNAFSPRVGLVYQPIQPVSLYTSWSRSFEPTFESDQAGNPFPPTRGEQFEAGVKTEFLNGRVSSTLSAYQITRRNEVVDDPNFPPGSGFLVQIGERRSHGIIFDLNGEPTPGLRLFLNYAFTNTEITVNPTSGQEGSAFDGVPQHRGSLWGVYEFQRGALKGLGLGGGVFVTGARPGNSPLVAAFATADALLYYKRDNWKVQLNFRNLTNKRFTADNDTDIFVNVLDPFTIRGTVSVTF
jgi:iron complex outermembrane recepter protein